jgi:hypothetical protein
MAQSQETETTNFNNIKDLILKDELEGRAQKLQNQSQKVKEQYNVPGDRDFWSVMSEYWLVKNAQKLKWDFPKPDYGIEESVKEMLEGLGYYEKKFKVLILNSPNLAHFALPSNPNEIIFLISLPFMRTLDLSKTEIALLFVENFLRIEVEAMLSTNFYGKKFDSTILEKILKNYSHFVFEKGFNFDQQFRVTQQMGGLLKSNMTLWNTYFNLIKKIDKLIKENSLYNYYSKIYPSPEMQIKWLTPVESKKI